MSIAKGIILLALVIGFYLLPAIIANIRNHRNETPIFILNLVAGWTVIGWIASLIWSFTSNTEPSEGKEEFAVNKETGTIKYKEAAATKKCPFCAEEVRLEAIKCKHCHSDLVAA